MIFVLLENKITTTTTTFWANTIRVTVVQHIVKALPAVLDTKYILKDLPSARAVTYIDRNDKLLSMSNVHLI